MRLHVIISFFLTFFLMSRSITGYSQGQKSILKITIRNIDSSGITWRSYNFDKNKITIYEKPFPVSNYKEHLHTVRKYNSRDLLKKVVELRLDSLKKSYQNNCTATKNGKEYIIEFETEKAIVSIKLFEYYVALIEDLINLINIELPKVLKISYFSKTTKQDCI